VEPNEVICDPLGRYVVQNIITNHTKITIASVYLPNLNSTRESIDNYIKKCQEINEAINTLNNGRLLIISGDFNLIFDPSLDAFGGNPTIYSEAKNWWMEFMERNNLIDTYRAVYPNDLQVTYRWSDLGRRLDYLLIPKELKKYVNEIKHYEISKSDHLYIRADIAITNQKIPIMWKFNESLEHDETFMTEYREKVIPELIVHCFISFPNDPVMRWELFKTLIRLKIKKYCSNVCKEKIKKKAALEHEIVTISAQVQADPNNRDKRNELDLKKEEMEQIEMEEAKQMAFNARIENYEYGEKSTKFFYGKMKSNFDNSNITELIIDGHTTSDPDKIAAEIQKFYKELYSKNKDVEELNASKIQMILNLLRNSYSTISKSTMGTKNI
jgi:hypothetical protein